MKKYYRILVTRPDGTKVYQPVVFTNMKKAFEYATMWNTVQPEYTHEVIIKQK